MKTKETSTKEQAIAWWDSLPVWGNPSKEYYMGLYYSDDNVTPERIEEIWKKENSFMGTGLTQSEFIDNCEKYFSGKPNQKQFVPNFSTKEEKLEMVIKKFNQKQFKQFDESLFKAYIDKFSKEDLQKASKILNDKILSDIFNVK